MDIKIYKMKQYFAKYLPVEGDIEGDYYFIEGSTLAIRKDIRLETEFTTEADNYPKKKVGNLIKLFLCSRDIQVGDKVYEPCFEHVGTYEVVGNMGENPKGLYKVIGKISPEATWVKDGDEFDEKDIRFTLNGEEYIFDLSDLPISGVIQIKGTCGHFH